MLIEEILNEFKRTHLEHIEDIILTGGHAGGQAVVDYFQGILQTLQGSADQPINVSVKWDGAPAVVCGINPENGRWFVGTKGVFAKTPKLNYTKEDIARNHGTDDLGQKLLKCLVHLKKLNIQGIVQGDFMFDRNTLSRQSINGQNYITFKPNTITYAVPENSDLGQKMSAAEVGIIFHTTYTGDTISNLQAQYGVDVVSFTRDPSVWFDNATYKNVSGTANFTKEEQSQFIAGIEQLKSLLIKVPTNLSAMLGVNKDFLPFFMLFINDQIRQGKIPTDTKQYLRDFAQFYQGRMQQQAAGLKAQKALQLRQQKMKDMPLFLKQMQKPLAAMMAFYKQVIALKNLTLAKLNKATAIGTFAQTDSGLEVTDPEGFVAVGQAGDAVKLVDRLGFSRKNLTAIGKFEKA
jgi:Family of unknown function (DUF6267)